MKKYFILSLFIVLSNFLYAQNNKMRLHVIENNGSHSSFLVERIDSIYFSKIEGEVGVDVEFNDFKMVDKTPELTISITQTPDCKYFRYCVLPKLEAGALDSDAAIARYFQNLKSTIMFQNFDHKVLTDFDFEFIENNEYSVIAIGYDKFNVACGSDRVDFTVPGKDVVGNPDVYWTVDELTPMYLRMTMCPNSDCWGIYYMMFKKGEADAVYEENAAMFGYNCMGDMIKNMSGSMHSGDTSQAWADLIPNRDYEVYIQTCDINGTYGKLIIVPIHTLQMGGEGLAEMTVEIGDFGGNPKSGYWQDVTYIPNDQCAAHRDMLIAKHLFDDGSLTEEEYIAYLKNETNPDFPDDLEWDFYGIDEAKWRVDPSTTYYIFTLAKNAVGEWGPVLKKEFTTPSVQAQAGNGSAPVKTVRLSK